MWPFLMAGAIYGFAAGAQPGPLNAYLMSLALRGGARRALPAAFAPLLSDALIVTVTLVVLTQIPMSFLRWLHLLGGAFVLYLAFDAWQTFVHFDNAQKQAQSQAVQSVVKATVINLLNPNPYVGWSLVLGPLLLRGWRSAPSNGMALVAGFYGALIGTTILTVLVFDFARTAGAKVTRWLVAASSVGLAAFGTYQLWLGVVTV